MIDNAFRPLESRSRESRDIRNPLIYAPRLRFSMSARRLGLCDLIDNPSIVNWGDFTAALFIRWLTNCRLTHRLVAESESDTKSESLTGFERLESMNIDILASLCASFNKVNSAVKKFAQQFAIGESWLISSTMGWLPHPGMGQHSVESRQAGKSSVPQLTNTHRGPDFPRFTLQSHT